MRVYVHYCVDSYGVTQVSLSGGRSYGHSMHKTTFNAAVTALKTVPAGKRRYDPTTKIWYIDNEYWQQIQQFFIKGSQIYELVSYRDEEAFENYLSGTVARTNNKWSGPDNQAAKNFFNNFNAAVEKIAISKSDKETLAELLGLQSFDAIPSDKTAAKKLYRAAAIRLHPDKNAGNGEQMAKLNELWGVYVQPTIQ